MLSRLKRLLIIAVVLLLIYVGSYVCFRAMHIDRWEADGHDYVIFPQSSAVYYFYRPLTYVDAQLTGMRFHIGPHR